MVNSRLYERIVRHMVLKQNILIVTPLGIEFIVHLFELDNIVIVNVID